MASPVPTNSVTIDIEGIKTQVLVMGYDDRIMVAVTQIASFGTLLFVKKDESYGGGEGTFNVTTLMGKRDEPLLGACARHLAELISQTGCSRPLLLSLGLRSPSQETLKSIIAVVLANRVW
eukprot:TRINITY_DN4358_c0_g1_i1.p1 TRINITY_DN4358_c0_g1~~TRINITY_DN4358_c0_g1_i1.p1  ORF type:complete len:121 (-),score=20.96 TRINITY_DN4358_c0_g1_i1:347-709(-)